VFDAIINKKYRSIPFFDPALVAAWRNYVVNDRPHAQKAWVSPERTPPKRATLPRMITQIDHRAQAADNGLATLGWAAPSGRRSPQRSQSGRALLPQASLPARLLSAPAC